MNREDAEEYTQALGQVVSGGWRQIALAQRLGVPQALNLSLDDWVNQRLGGYVRLSIAERRAAVAELEAEGLKQRDIAATLGVGVGTVNRDLAVPDGTENGESEPEKSNDETPSVPNGTDPIEIVPEQMGEVLEVLAEQEERQAQRAANPEEFAGDELFDVLDCAMAEAEHWALNLCVNCPGRMSLDQWRELLTRMNNVLTTTRHWTEHREVNAYGR